MATLPFYSTSEKPDYPGAVTQWVDIGEGTRAFLAVPERGEPPYRAMILGHERYGLVLDTLDQTQKFAAYGYDEHVGTWESPEPHPDITATDWIWSAQDKVKRWDRTAFFVERTLDFLRRHRDAPCFVNLWLDDPHTPWVPSADDQQLGTAGRAAGKGDTPGRLAKVKMVLAWRTALP